MSDYTKAQQDAINHDGSSVLISASAGSGKTKVMVDKIIKLVLSQKAQINEILAVTYTQLAAKQIKEKVGNALVKNITEGNYDYIREQLNLLRTANISTIHSFCGNLLRTYFYEAGLDANFGVIDETEADKLKSQAIDSLFEDKYEEEDKDFLSLVRIFSQKRSDASLKQNIISLYEFVIAESDPYSLFDTSLSYYTEEGIEKIKGRIYSRSIGKLNHFLSRFEEFSDYFAQNGMPKTDKAIKQTIAEIKVMLSAVDLERIIKYAETADFPSLPAEVKKDDDRYEVKSKASDIKSELTKFIKWLVSEVKPVFMESRLKGYFNMREVIEKYFSLIKNFMEYFDSLKRQENVVDFSDLEHLTYKLLKNREVAESVRDSFKYVFIDEYQDVNGVQEAIFNSLSKDNVFMVGDLKQSIYGFRGCNPEFFSQKFGQFLQGEGGKAIFLEENFRSAPAVLDAVNNIFGRVMKREFSSVEYSENPMKYGGLYNGYRGEAYIHSVTYDKTKEKQKLTGVYDIEKHLSVLNKNEENKKAQFLARLIKDEVGKKIYDLKTGKERRVTFGDIVILTRGLGKNEEDICTGLMSYGIPVSVESKKSIGDYPEIRQLIDLLTLILSRTGDIPLVSVMKSPVGSFTDSELVKIRSAYPNEKSFYDAFTQYVLNKNDNLSAKLKEFGEYMDRIRLLSEYESASEILSRVIVEKNIDAYYLGTSFGKLRTERINFFVQYCDGGKKYSVREFIDRIDYILKNATLSSAGEEDTVKMMTIHSSKGLEFPVVILNDCAQRFNNKEVKAEIYTDRKEGIAFKNYDYLRGIVDANNPYRLLMKLAMSERTVREEMRLLYVALTRAECRLHIVVYNGNLNGDKYIGDYNCYSDYIRENDAPLIEYGEEIFGGGLVQESVGPRHVIVADYSEQTAEKIYKNLSFAYPYQQDVTLPVKRTVTSALEKEESFYERSALFGESDTDTGNAYHKALEVMDFYGDFDREWQNFVSIAGKEQSGLVDKEKLRKILALPIFETLDGYRFYKEQPFTANICARDILGVDTDREILVQGVIDLLAIKDGKAIIVDYKHTTIAKDEDLVKKYFKQLFLYKTAVQRVLGLEVEGCYLLNVYSVRLVKIDKF